MSLFVATPARAATPPICDQALALRVNSRGLGFVIDQVKPLIPSELEVPAITQTVVDWPLTNSDAVVHVAATRASIKLSTLVARTDGTALRIQGEADIATGTTVLVDHPYLGLGSATCQADVQLIKVGLDIALALRREGGSVTAKVERAKISFDPSSVVALEGCALGKLLTDVLDFVRGHFMSTLQATLESIARDKIATLIAAKLGETTQLSRELGGLVFTGRLDGVATDEAGVALTLGVGVSATQPTAAPCVAGVDSAPPQLCVGAAAQLSAQGDAMFGAGVSGAMLDQALHAIWRSGRLCASSTDLGLPLLAQGMDRLAAGLGQPQGTRLGFAVRLGRPPRLRLTAQRGVELLVDALLLRLTLAPPDGPAGEVALSADLVVAGTPWVDPAGNVVALDLHDVATRRLELLDGGELKLDPARLQRFLDTVVVPVLRERLAAAPLSASVMNIKDVLVHLRSFQVGDGHLAAQIDAYANVPSGDKLPPRTILLQGPEGDVGPQVLRLLVGGQDNRTPAALLRFQARVDGGPWSEPRFGGWIDVTMSGGTHVVEVAAVDLDGNVGAPVRLAVHVDDVVPQLVITSRPESLVGTRSIAVGFAARDDRTPVERLRFTAELYRVPDGGGMPELVRTMATASPARLDGLEDGVYKLRVIVADLAGNVTSEDIGFSVAADGGCSLAFAPAAAPAAAAAAAAAPPVALLLLGLGLVVAVLRRRQRLRRRPCRRLCRS